MPVLSTSSSDDPHHITYFRRHLDDDPDERTPGREFLRRCPPKVRATMSAVLVAVANAPPKRYAGGGYWEDMRAPMNGFFEVRVDGPRRHHYRLFCLLDYEAWNFAKPLVVIVDGRAKPFGTRLSRADYAVIKDLGDEYRARNPRSWA